MLWARRAGLILCSLALLECGRTTIQPSAPPLSSLFEGHPGVTPLHVESHDHSPTLQTIAREGDPSGAVSIAIQTANSREALSLYGLLKARLGGSPPDSFGVSRLGLTVTRLVQSGEQATAFLTLVKHALEEPVSPRDKALGSVETLFARYRSSGLNVSTVDACLGVLGSEGEAFAPLAPGELESIRKLVGSARMGLGALGAQGIREAARKIQLSGWNPGGPLETGPLRAPSWGIRSGPTTMVRVAIQTPRIAEAFAVAKSLADPAHPLRAKVEALGRGFRYQEAHVTADAEGACLGVTVAEDDRAAPTQVDALVETTFAVQSELSVALDGARASEDLALSILAPSSPIAAVALGAWTAAPRMLREGEIWVREAITPRASDLQARDLEARLDKLGASSEQDGIPLVRAAESGQPESWLLVASPCGFAPEPETEAGFRATTVQALALHFSGQEGVELEPWYAQEGVGLLAHARPLRGESVRNHALRLARRAAMALWGFPVDGQEVARARAKLLRQVGDDPARKLALSILGGEHPSMLDGRGSSDTLSRLSSLDVEEVRGQLAREPLRAALLDSAGSDQSAAVQEGLNSWLRRDARALEACKTGLPAPARPGLWRLATASAGVVPSRWLAVPSLGPAAGGLGLEYLLGRPGGYLDDALSSTPTHAEVAYLGGPQSGAFLVRLTGDPEVLDFALNRLRVELDTLAQRGASDGDLSLLVKRYRAELFQNALSPRGRVTQLWRGEPESELNPEMLAVHVKSLAASAHRIIEVNVKP